MSLWKTVLAGIAGTTGMTLFSYYVSRKRRKQFREPELLHRIVEKSPLPDTGDKKPGRLLDGWLMHYTTGFLFSAVYNRIWKKTDISPSIPVGILLGAISGLVGISIWAIILNLHPNPPQIDRSEYYRHLLNAHIIFGFWAALGYRKKSDYSHHLFLDSGKEDSIPTNVKWNIP